MTLSQEWQFLEMFAGQANVSRACRESFFRGASMDLDYGGRAMDLSTDVGMAFLDPHMFWGYQCTLLIQFQNAFTSLSNACKKKENIE